MKSMCPDHQILSVYLDAELPSPWREKMESHLAQCETCREKLAAYRLVRSLEFPEAALQQARDRVWKNLQAAGSTYPETKGKRFAETGNARYPETAVFWRRNVSLPFPAAAAAAALLLIALAALWLRLPAGESDTRDTAIAASENLDMRGIAPVSDMSGVLQYLGSKDSGDYVILRLPESRNFMTSGEPAIIKAADYSRRNTQR
ncbi:MAG: hypothetical protein LBN21_08915 [Treponema sp.]|jgi:anti-sigma factor RsiW|nr:hypothetical protein [Treponema sp.]